MSKQVTVVSVTLEDAEGELRVYSDGLPGLMLCGRNKQAICDNIAPAIRAILEYKGHKVAAVLPDKPIREIMGQPSPRQVDMHVLQFVVEYQDAA